MPETIHADVSAFLPCCGAGSSGLAIMTAAITILGCGSSGGVPRVAQGWGACDPNEPRNRRRRCSILIEAHDHGPAATKILVDASPDLREQLLSAGADYLDAVILTHDHADHTHGIDDLRPLTIHERRRIDVYTNAQTAQTMLSRFGYCFVRPENSGYPPILTLHEVDDHGQFVVTGRGGNVTFSTVPVQHGDLNVLALKFKKTVYTPDISSISSKNESYFSSLDLWIIDGLRPSPHPTHFSLDEALFWIDRMRPRRAVLTNLHTDLDYGALTAMLPPNVVAAYDGMRIEIG